MVRLWASGFMNNVDTSYYQPKINTPYRREEAETMINFVEVIMPHHYFMAWQMMFSKKIRFVCFDWDLVNE